MKSLQECLDVYGVSSDQRSQRSQVIRIKRPSNQGPPNQGREFLTVSSETLDSV